MANPLLEQGVELVVIKQLLGHARISVTTTVYAHVGLRLQRDAIDLLSPAENTGKPDDGDEPLLCCYNGGPYYQVEAAQAYGRAFDGNLDRAGKGPALNGHGS